MNISYPLSHVAQAYLDEFHKILSTMIRSMTSARLGNSISYNFMVQMIPHHRAAIEMSRNLLRYTTNIPLQTTALEIINQQTQSIDNMQKILCCCGRRCNSQKDLFRFQNQMNQIMTVMFSAMEQAPDANQIDEDFIREMIPHHRGAVEMSELTLRFSICPELLPILQAIIVSQKQGIARMQQILQTLEQ